MAMAGEIFGRRQQDAKNTHMETNKIMKIAHRGARAYAPENTITAFREALRLGADMIEIDVRRTRDKHLVVFHDVKVTRLTNKKGRLKKFLYNQLREFKVSGEEIPTLLEVLRFLKGQCQINIHLKERRMADDVARVVREFGMEKDVLFSSFHNLELAKIRAMDKKFRVAILFASQPVSLAYPMKLARLLQAEAINLHLENTSRRYIEKLVKAAEGENMRVNVWTANETEDIEWLKGAGVHGIITDYLDRL